MRMCAEMSVTNKCEVIVFQLHCTVLILVTQTIVKGEKISLTLLLPAASINERLHFSVLQTEEPDTGEGSLC